MFWVFIFYNHKLIYFRFSPEDFIACSKECLTMLKTTNEKSIVETSYHLPKHYILSMSGHNANINMFKDNFRNIDFVFGIKNITILLQQIRQGLLNQGHKNVTISFGDISYKFHKRYYEINIKEFNHPKLPLKNLFMSIKPFIKELNFFVKRPMFSYQDESRIVLEIKNEKTKTFIYTI